MTPKTIFVWVDPPTERGQKLRVGWTEEDRGTGAVPYVRRDLFAETCSENMRLKEPVKRLGLSITAKPLDWIENPDRSEGGLIAVGAFGTTYHAMDDGWCIHRAMQWHDENGIEAAKRGAEKAHAQGLFDWLQEGVRDD